MKDSRRSNAGFPDLICLKGERMLVIELKSERGRMTPEQDAWHDAFRAFAMRGDVVLAVFRPRDWLSGTIVEVLRGAT